MPSIQCFMLRPIGRVSYTPESNPDVRASLAVHEAPDGSKYHIGYADGIKLDDGTPVPKAPPGAMWDADWYEGSKLKDGRPYNRNPDGVTLCVRTPGGDWLVDGPSFTNREEVGSWSRTGALPNVTATPSIHIPGKYHGWLRDGQLVEC